MFYFFKAEREEREDVLLSLLCSDTELLEGLTTSVFCFIDEIIDKCESCCEELMKTCSDYRKNTSFLMSFDELRW